MIITFQGAKTRGRNVGAMTVLCAATEAFRKNKKVLIMSLRDYQEGGNIEDYALPKDLGLTDGDGLLKLSGYTYSDTGLDAAIRRIGAGKFTKEQLDTCVTPTVKAKNGLDILKSTKEAAFEKTLNNRFEYIKEIMEVANTVYDYVFVYVPSTNNKFIDKLNSFVDKIVVVVRQGAKEDMASVNSKYPDKVRILVMGFEDESTWNEKKIRAMYDVKTIYKAPHNVRYNDSREDGEVIRFAMQNYKDDKGDYNYPLFNELNKLLDFIDGKEEPTLFSFDEEIKLTNEKKEKLGLRKYNPPRTEVITEKKFFGLKTETYKKAVFTDTPVLTLEDKLSHDDDEEDMTPAHFEEGEYTEHHGNLDIEELMGDDLTSDGSDNNGAQKDNYDRTDEKNESSGDKEYSWLNDLDDDEKEEKEDVNASEKSIADEHVADVSTEKTGSDVKNDDFDFDFDFDLDDDKPENNNNADMASETPAAEDINTDIAETESPVSGNEFDFNSGTTEHADASEATYDAEKVLSNMGIYIRKPELKPYPEKPVYQEPEKPDTSEIDGKINYLKDKGNEIKTVKKGLDNKAQTLMNEVSNGNMDAMTEMQEVLNKTKSIAEKKQKLDIKLISLQEKREAILKEYSDKKLSFGNVVKEYEDKCRAVDDENKALMDSYNKKCKALLKELSNLQRPEIPDEPQFEELSAPDFTEIDRKIELINNKKAEITDKKTELNNASKALLTEVSAGNMDAMSKMQEMLNEVKSITMKIDELNSELKRCDSEKAQKKESYDNELARRKAAKAEYEKSVLAAKHEYEEKRRALIARYTA